MTLGELIYELDEVVNDCLGRSNRDYSTLAVENIIKLNNDSRRNLIELLGWLNLYKIKGS